MPGNRRSCDCGECPKCRHREAARRYQREWTGTARRCCCGRCPDCRERDRIRTIEIDAWLATRTQLPPAPMTRRGARHEQKITRDNAATPTSRWSAYMGAGFNRRTHYKSIPRSDDYLA